MTKKINENLERYDLKNLVDSLFFVDRHVSKLGTDAEVAVITFKCQNKGSAQDLVNFLEKSFTWILDAGLSTGADAHQKWLVFVEIDRNKRLVQHILELIEEVENLTDRQNWTFKYKKNARTHQLSEENLEMYVPSSAEEYLKSLRTDVLNGVRGFFESSNMHDFSVDEQGNVRITKQINEWSPKIEIGFTLNSVCQKTPSSLTPSMLSRTVGSLLGENFVVEDISDKFYIHNGKSTLEVSNLYAENK